MVKHLLTTTAVTLALASAGLAQQAPPTTPAQTREQPAQAQQQQAQPAQPQAGQQPVEQQAAQPVPTEQEEPAEEGEQPAGEPFIVAQEVGQVLADRVLGKEVVNPQDEEVGEISDLVFDEEGRILAAVIGVGGFLGLGQKAVAVSWDQIEWTPMEDGSVELSMPFTREELEQAPEFKDLAAIRAEEEAERMQQPAAGAPGGVAPAPTPAAPPAQQ